MRSWTIQEEPSRKLRLPHSRVNFNVSGFSSTKPGDLQWQLLYVALFLSRIPHLLEFCSSRDLSLPCAAE
jgi:hypothetical protein